MSQGELMTIPQKNTNTNVSEKFYDKSRNDLSNLNLSSIPKDDITNYYHFLCKNCGNIPELEFTEKSKIKYRCECTKSVIKELYLEEIYNYLCVSEERDKEFEKLNCTNHKNEKYRFYCEICKENKCSKCVYKCSEHKIIKLNEDTDTKDKISYIIEKKEEFEKDKFQNIKSEDISDFSITKSILKKKTISNEINKNSKNIENKFFKKKENKTIIFKKDQKELENEINIINNAQFEDEEYRNPFNLFSIIINDYKNYPNYNLIKTISNIEKFVILYCHDYNEIILNYEFQKDDIKNNSIELFGEKFVNNNKENSFLIIRKKILDISRFINLKEIFDVLPTNFPLNLEIKLIERKKKKMKDLSFMFYEISTITSKSKFDGFNSDNITNMSNMFCNCSSLQEIPDISKFNTKNVTDMSYLFYNCSLLKQLPDISDWEMENVSNTRSMFENCLSLSTLPDISNWNTKNIKNMNCMFKNCESLLYEPNLSKWIINKDTQTNQMFDGDLFLKGNIIIFRIIKFIKYIFKCWDNYYSIIKKSDKFSLCIFTVTNFILNCLTFIPIYSSFNLDRSIESISDPIEYFHLNDFKNINMDEFKKTADLNSIKESLLNKEKYINNILNFTNINEVLQFKSYQRKYQIYNIIIIFGLFLSSFLLIYINLDIQLNINEDTTNIKKENILLSILFIVIVISIVAEFLDYIIIKKILETIDIFFNKTKNIFKVNIPQINRNEYKYLEYSFFIILFNSLIFSFLFYAALQLKELLEQTKKIIEQNNYNKFWMEKRKK